MGVPALQLHHTTLAMPAYGMKSLQCAIEQGISLLSVSAQAAYRSAYN